MKVLSLMVFLIVVPLAAGAIEIDGVPEKSASYFCKGNKNFLACIKPEIEFDSRWCMDYVMTGSGPCVEKELGKLSGRSSESEIEEAAILYAQCSMMELLKIEGIEYGEFQDCFNSQYDESLIHSKIQEYKQ